MSSTSALTSAALVSDAIARIGERRDALDQLAAKGMEMCERLAAGEKVEIPGRKPFADEGRAFAVVSRAVRLCLALASRLDEILIGILQGGPIPDLAILAPETKGAPAPRAAFDPVADAREVPAVHAAIEVEAGEGAERFRACGRERLREGEAYEVLLHRPWRVVVEAICADLGLRPNWAAWDAGEGFKLDEDSPPDELGAVVYAAVPKASDAIDRVRFSRPWPRPPP